MYFQYHVIGVWQGLTSLRFQTSGVGFGKQTSLVRINLKNS